MRCILHVWWLAYPYPMLVHHGLLSEFTLAWVHGRVPCNNNSRLPDFHKPINKDPSQNNFFFSLARQNSLLSLQPPNPASQVSVKTPTHSSAGPPPHPQAFFFAATVPEAKRHSLHHRCTTAATYSGVKVIPGSTSFHGKILPIL